MDGLCYALLVEAFDREPTAHGQFAHLVFCLLIACTLILAALNPG